MAGNLIALNLPERALVSLETQNQASFLATVGPDLLAPPSFAPERAIGGGGTFAVTIGPGESLAYNAQLAGNLIIDFQNLTPDRTQWGQIRTIQAFGGNWTFGLRAAGVAAKTPGGTPLAISTANGAIDIVSFYWTGSILYAQVSGKGFA